MAYRNLGYFSTATNFQNLFIGPGTGRNVTNNNAPRNVMVGQLAGSSGSQFFDCVYIGYNARSTNSTSNTTVIGSGATHDFFNGGNATIVGQGAYGFVDTVVVGQGARGGNNSIALGKDCGGNAANTISIGESVAADGGANNILIGGAVTYGLQNNVHIGYGGIGNTSSQNSVVVGYTAAAGIETQNSIVEGVSTFSSASVSAANGIDRSVVSGYLACRFANVRFFTDNVIIGVSAAENFGNGGAQDCEFNTFIGSQAGSALSGSTDPFGEGNTIVGADLLLPGDGSASVGNLILGGYPVTAPTLNPNTPPPGSRQTIVNSSGVITERTTRRDDYAAIRGFGSAIQDSDRGPSHIGLNIAENNTEAEEWLFTTAPTENVSVGIFGQGDNAQKLVLNSYFEQASTLQPNMVLEDSAAITQDKGHPGLSGKIGQISNINSDSGDTVAADGTYPVTAITTSGAGDTALGTSFDMNIIIVSNEVVGVEFLGRSNNYAASDTITVTAATGVTINTAPVITIGTVLGVVSAPAGSLFLYTYDPTLYVNEGTALAPSWQAVSVGGGSGNPYIRGTVQTTDATLTTLTSVSTTTNGRVYVVKGEVTGYSQTADEAGSFTFKTAWRRTGGVLTELSTTTEGSADAGFTGTVSATASGTDILVQVTGEASETIDWELFGESIGDNV